MRFADTVDFYYLFEVEARGAAGLSSTESLKSAGFDARLENLYLAIGERCERHTMKALSIY